jgi:acyl-CoA dehydrogenase
MAYCMTEPDAGSDVAGIKTTAIRKGDHYHSQRRQDVDHRRPGGQLLHRLRQDRPQDARHRGMSCFIVEREWAGVSTSKPLEKLGQHAAQACQVFFENVEVPAENLLGREGDGFMIGMKVFDKSRPPVAAAATGVARRALDEAVKYAGERSRLWAADPQLPGRRLHAGRYEDSRRSGAHADLEVGVADRPGQA